MVRINSGTRVGAPLGTKLQSASQRYEVEGLIVHSNDRMLFENFTDFEASTLILPWAARTATTAGTPTFSQVANSANGQFQALLAANNEAETAGFDWADVRMIQKPDAGSVNVNPISTPVFQAYVQIPTALAANQTLVIGLATAFNATLTSIAKYMWFRFSANNNVLIESKDGTTTSTGNSPAEGTITVDTNFHLYTLDFTFADACKFWLDDNLLGTLNVLGLAATDRFQPVMYLQKSTGTTTPAVNVDWCHTINYRY